MKKVLVINSAKGGVGKTEVAKGTAIELLNRGETVSILDMDVTTPNIGHVLGVETYSAPQGMVMNKNMIKGLIKSTIDEMEDGWLIIDTPPTISSAYMAIVEVIKNAKFLFVTTPSPNAVKDTGVGIRFFTQRGVVPIGIVQNMVNGPFGNTIDSEKELGVKTIGEIPLMTYQETPVSDNIEVYFISIVDYILKIDFEDVVTEKQVTKIMSNVTIEDIEGAPFKDSLDLKFYNLETWDYVREKLVDKELAIAPRFAKSHFNIDTNTLSRIINLGENTMVMIKDGLGVEGAPLPYEIQYADIVYDNPVSKGLPMFKLQNGIYLWSDECILADSKLIKDTMDDGGIQVAEGRIAQSLYGQLYLNRAYSRNGLEYEVNLIKRHIKETSTQPTQKELVYIIYKLERDGDAAFGEFLPDAYIEMQKDEYPDFYNHLLNIQELSHS